VLPPFGNQSIRIDVESGEIKTSKSENSGRSLPSPGRAKKRAAVGSIPIISIAAVAANEK
jgi:hypothetical protein